jgi:glycosyltransferase involved in cell wall biosynthesis
MAALAHGAAIITTPAAPEEPLLKGAVAYTPVSDALGLARTIRRLLEDSTERAALKDSALRVSRQFEWPAIAQKFVQFATPLIDR